MNKQKYYIFYKRLRDIGNDNDIFPNLSDHVLSQFISQEDWMGIPSFGILSKEQMTGSSLPHLGFNLRTENKVSLSVFFNGKNAVERLCNILLDISSKQKKEFVEILRNLDGSYKYYLLYTVKVANAASNWQRVSSGQCNNLTDKEIDQLLKEIEDLKNRRDSEQKTLSPGWIATIGVNLASVKVDISDDLKLKKALDNLIKILKVAYDIKTSAEIKKIERDETKLIKIKKCIGCGQIFKNNSEHKSCPTCIFPLEKNKMIKKEYDDLKAKSKVRE